MVEEMISVNAERWKKLEAMEAKAKLSARRATVKNLIYVEKAKKALISVTKAEIDAWIAADDVRKAAEVASATEED